MMETILMALGIFVLLGMCISMILGFAATILFYRAIIKQDEQPE